MHIKAMGAEQDLQNVPGVANQPDAATKDFIFQQVIRRAAPNYNSFCDYLRY